MKHFIENNIRTIINIVIIVLFILPAIVALYLIILGVSLNVNQAIALISLFSIGCLALGAFQLTDI